LCTVIHIYLTTNCYLFIVKIGRSCVFRFKLVSILYFIKIKKTQSPNLPSNLLFITKLKEWY